MGSSLIFSRNLIGCLILSRKLIGCLILSRNLIGCLILSRNLIGCLILSRNLIGCLEDWNVVYGEKIVSNSCNFKFFFLHIHRRLDRIQSEGNDYRHRGGVRRSLYHYHHLCVLVQTTPEEEVRKISRTQRKLCGKSSVFLCSIVFYCILRERDFIAIKVVFSGQT